MFNKLKQKINNYQIEKVKSKFKEDSIARIYKLAKLGEPNAILELEKIKKESYDILKKYVDSGVFKKRMYERYLSGNFLHTPTRKEIKQIENMEVGDEFDFDQLVRMVNNMKLYRRNTILFYITWAGTIITLASAGITLFGILCK